MNSNAQQPPEKCFEFFDLFGLIFVPKKQDGRVLNFSECAAEERERARLSFLSFLGFPTEKEVFLEDIFTYSAVRRFPLLKKRGDVALFSSPSFWSKVESKHLKNLLGT